MSLQLNGEDNVEAQHDRSVATMTDEKERADFLQKLSFYREEVKHEFNLLGVRSSILVSCQSFLFVPFAILHTFANYKAVFFPLILIISIGISVAGLMIKPIKTAHSTIGKWLIKQRALMKRYESHNFREDFSIDRDQIENADHDIKADIDHIGSIAFSKYSPGMFIAFWIIAALWVFARMFVLQYLFN